MNQRKGKSLYPAQNATLADLYGPDLIPPDLRHAYQKLDRSLDNGSTPPQEQKMMDRDSELTLFVTINAKKRTWPCHLERDYHLGLESGIEPFG